MSIDKDQALVEDKRLRWRNFPLWLLTGLIEVASMGEEKYGTYDYLKPKLTVNDHLDAAKRHAVKFEDPTQSDYDHESGQLHVFHCAWRYIVAGFVHKTYPKLDDRYKGEINEKTSD